MDYISELATASQLSKIWVGKETFPCILVEKEAFFKYCDLTLNKVTFEGKGVIPLFFFPSRIPPYILMLPRSIMQIPIQIIRVLEPTALMSQRQNEMGDLST